MTADKVHCASSSGAPTPVGQACIHAHMVCLSRWWRRVLLTESNSSASKLTRSPFVEVLFCLLQETVCYCFTWFLAFRWSKLLVCVICRCCCSVLAGMPGCLYEKKFLLCVYAYDARQPFAVLSMGEQLDSRAISKTVLHCVILPRLQSDHITVN